ncbi:MAG TPA: SufD family Fe-S cluster assembly protein [Rhodocyclaceae bacterium]|nr:SufD family Fe-S cluster assembly protein [Rhodocyclaceae bacterium]
MPDFAPLYDAFRQFGGNPDPLLAPDAAHLIAYGHQLVSRQTAPGVSIDAEAGERGVRARVTVEAGRIVPQPVHLCFGLFEPFGIQDIALEMVMGEGSEATFWSHCLFTLPEKARHTMDARIELKPGARLTQNEVHYHGPSGGIVVVPKARVRVGEGARYRADFSLVQGRVGMLAIDYGIEVAARGTAELTSKVFGHRTDDIAIVERISLDGPEARGLIKTRVAVEDDAQARIVGATYGNAAGARGHVDCLEIVRGRAVASAVPEVKVSHPEAKVTHEAAIGSVDQRQLEALMARGLSPEEAVDRIILGMLQ